ncbi:MAG: ferritin-like domain-containing protein [Nannocystaceae bacterium]
MHRLSAALARALSPLVWRSPAHAARKLHAFALAEQGSMLDMRLAARLTDSPARAAAYLRHADDEARHAQMFARRAARLHGESGRPGPLPPLRADSERLFERLGERDFLAFVHRGETRARAQFEAYVAWFKGAGRDLDRTLFETILVDERRHCDYSRQFLVDLVGEAEARRALARVGRWELGRDWLRAGRFVAERVYVAAMVVVYVLCAPLSLLLRIARPIRAGWQRPAGIDAGARSPAPRAISGASSGMERGAKVSAPHAIPGDPAASSGIDVGAESHASRAIPGASPPG